MEYKNYLYLLSASLIGGLSTEAQVIETFDSAPALSDTQAADTWYRDRYNPAGFESVDFDGDNRLKITVSADDESATRPGGFSSTFYNTQGRKLDTPGATSLFGEVYVDSSLEGLGRITGLWGTAIDGDGVITNYPILELQSDAAGSFSIGLFDSSVMWALEEDISASIGSWVSLGIRLEGLNTVYSINGADVYSANSNGTLSFSNLILNTYNADDQRGFSAYWDNVGYGVNPVPEPATLAGISLLTALGLVALRRRLKGRRA